MYQLPVTNLEILRKSRKKVKRILSDIGLQCCKELLEEFKSYSPGDYYMKNTTWSDLSKWHPNKKSKVHPYRTKPFCCSLCDFSTKYINAYKSHMRCYHEDEMDMEMLVGCPNCTFTAHPKLMKKHGRIFHLDTRRAHAAANHDMADQVGRQTQPKTYQGKMPNLVKPVYYCRKHNSVCGSKARDKGTKYGKLSQSGNKSGSGGKTLTPRQQCIIDKWSFTNSQRVRVERRQSTMKFDKKKPLPSMSSEEVVDPLEGTSASTPSTSQQHNKTSRTTASSTPTATGVEEREASHPELITARTQQATEAGEARQAMTQPQTSHERAIDIFQGFLKTELLKIPENMWFKYTMAAMTIAHNFSQPPQSVIGPPQTPPPVMSCSPMATSPTGKSPSPTHSSSSTHRNSSGSLHQHHHSR